MQSVERTFSGNSPLVAPLMQTMKRLRLIAVVTVAVATAPATAGATPPLHWLGTLPGPGLSTDGVRYAVVVTSATEGRLFDDARGRERRLTWPVVCPDHSTPSAAVGGGAVLVGCDRRYAVYDIASATWTLGPEPPGDQLTAETFGYTSIGSRYIEWWAAGYHFNFPGVLDRLTGRTSGVSDDPRLVLDLSHGTPMRRLCRPLRRRQDSEPPVDNTPRSWNYEYEPPYGLAWTDRGVRIERCGRRGSKRLDSSYAGDAQLGAHTVTWSHVTNGSSYVKALRLDSGRRWRWRIRFTQVVPLAVRHTARWIYLAVPRVDQASPSEWPVAWTLMRARIPGG
jgi:hypothetical protein